MKLSPDDPRLTAYVLEELDPAEQVAVDDALRQDPERYRDVLDLGRTAMALSETLRQAAVGLTETQEAEVEDALAGAGAGGEAEPAPANVVRFPGILRSWAPILGGIAAALVAAWILWPEMPKDLDLASVANPPSAESGATRKPPAQPAPEPTPPPATARTTTPEPAAGSSRPIVLPNVAPSGPGGSIDPELVARYGLLSPESAPLPAGRSPRPDTRSEHMQWDPAVQPPRAAPAPSLASPQPAPQMDELMMRRYGLIPAERSGEGANDPAMDPNFDWSTYDPSAPVSAAPPKAAPGPQMDELMMRRYGLIPPASYQIGHSQPVMDAYGRWRMPPPSYADESYSHPAENPFQLALQNPLSTFGLEVDTASYAIVRRFINENRRPPVDAVRVEEMINYFTYDYPAPAGDDPLAVHLEVAGCPWNSAHRLVRVGLKAREIAHATRPACNLVFLIDVSGSMSPENKLPLLRQGLLMLTDRLRGDDSVGIVTYAGGAGVALPPTSGGQRQRIRDTLTALQAGGSTHGSAGIRRAYELARQNFREDGVNRVILCTDGDFNVGVTSQSDLTRLIENEAKSGIFLTVLGFGVGNYKDTTMEALADRGNGQYAYIDNLNEAHKVLVNEITSTLVTVAKDVKLQVEFNPAKVQAYRLIGYENRLLRAEDFNDDRKDAGEIGAGHSVTALYEIVPPGVAFVASRVDPLKYQQPAAADPAFEGPSKRLTDSPEMLTAKLRWKAPDAETSVRREFTLVDTGRRYGQASADFKFAAAVAAYGMILTDSPNRGTTSLDAVMELAGEGLGPDRDGYRADFLELVRRTKALSW